MAVALTAVGAAAQTVNIPQSALLPPGNPGMISWNAADAGLEGTVTFKLIVEVTGTAVANGFLLDVQKNGYPAPPIGGATDDVIVFPPEAVPGAMATVTVPAGCNFAMFHDVFNETGGFLTGPNGILDDVGVDARDAYLNSDSSLNYSVVGRLQLVKYYPANPALSYSFTSQWGTTTQLGSGYSLFIFLDDDHSPNYDYDDMVVGVVAPACVQNADCDDGNACNGAEYCNAGTCKPGSPVSCDDGDDCNGMESCVNGSCESGTPLNCDDGIECTVDSCENSACVHVPANEHCHNDGLYCNGSELCDASLGCVSTGSPCPAEKVCDEETESCRDCQVDADCDDADPCTVGHECNDGTCQLASPVDCSSLDTPCERAACSPLGLPGNCDNLLPQPNGTPCSDGDACTMTDGCINGECVPGHPVDCAQLAGPCESLACDPFGAEGNCDVIDFLPDGTPCSDGNHCTVEDVCDSGVCKPGADVDCSDADTQCSIAKCDPLGPPGNCDLFDALPDGTLCDNDTPCIEGEVCELGFCVGELIFGLGDWHTLAGCLAGPAQAMVEGCECADIDSNGSVNLIDLFHFQNLFDAP